VSLFAEPDDATLIGPAEAKELRLSWITTRQELNAAEQDNILAGLVLAHRRRQSELLSEAFVRRLHREMFGEVWHWAGKLRRHQTNIGVSPGEIPVQLRALLADVVYWIDNGSYPTDEIAVRLHHRMVALHPFTNGNGRHTRLLADLLAEQKGRPPFTWGGQNLSDPGELRRRYIASLQRADAHDIGPLLAFARE
jgi:Fic-DOC domain mobile mystery protein B